jgi:hypothetical protein
LYANGMKERTVVYKSKKEESDEMTPWENSGVK